MRERKGGERRGGGREGDDNVAKAGGKKKKVFGDAGVCVRGSHKATHTLKD